MAGSKSKKKVKKTRLPNGVKWFTLSKRRDIFPCIKELRRLYLTTNNLYILGEPLALQGNHIVLILLYKRYRNIRVKIDGPKQIIFILRHVLKEIEAGRIKEFDLMGINAVAFTY